MASINVNSDAPLDERRLSMTTANFLSTKHDPKVLRQISTMEIDLSDDDDCSIKERLIDERLSMMLASLFSIGSTQHDAETLGDIKKQLSERRLSIMTADFLSTKHDPKILRLISTMEVDLGEDGSLHCPGLDESDVSRYIFDERDEDEERDYDHDELESKDDTEIVCEMNGPQVKIQHRAEIALWLKDAVTIGFMLGCMGFLALPYSSYLIQCCKLLICVDAAAIGFVLGYLAYYYALP